jgi:uncharacterized membrane protein YfbV (UPF0208 family)
MNPNVLTAAISAGAAVITAVAALVLNHRGFAMLGDRISDTHRRIDDIAARLRTVETYLKEFFKVQADLDKRLGRIEDKLGIPPR